MKNKLLKQLNEYLDSYVFQDFLLLDKYKFKDLVYRYYDFTIYGPKKKTIVGRLTFNRTFKNSGILKLRYLGINFYIPFERISEDYIEIISFKLGLKSLLQLIRLNNFFKSNKGKIRVVPSTKNSGYEWIEPKSGENPIVIDDIDRNSMYISNMRCFDLRKL